MCGFRNLRHREFKCPPEVSQHASGRGPGLETEKLPAETGSPTSPVTDAGAAIAPTYRNEELEMRPGSRGWGTNPGPLQGGLGRVPAEIPGWEQATQWPPSATPVLPGTPGRPPWAWQPGRANSLRPTSGKPQLPIGLLRLGLGRRGGGMKLERPKRWEEWAWLHGGKGRGLAIDHRGVQRHLGGLVNTGPPDTCQDRFRQVCTRVWGWGLL